MRYKLQTATLAFLTLLIIYGEYVGKAGYAED